MQNVNLYQRDRNEAQRAARPRQMRLGLLALCALGLAHGLWLGWQSYRSGASLAAAERQATLAESALNELAGRFQVPRLDADLPRQVSALEDDNRRLERVLARIGELEQARGPGFLVLLSGLSEYHRPGLWLTRIRLQDGGRDLLLEGQTVEQELLPRYLEGLGNSPAFAGRSFARFDLSREPGQPLQFQLASSLAEEDRP